MLLLNSEWGGWFDWLVLLQAYKLSLCFSPLPCSLFYQTGMFCRATSGSGSLILLVVSQQTSCRLLYAFHAPWPCSILLSEMLELSWASSDSRSLLVLVARLLIARSMNNITGPTNARIEPGYKLNCTRSGMVGGARDFAHALTTQFAMF